MCALLRSEWIWRYVSTLQAHTMNGMMKTMGGRLHRPFVPLAAVAAPNCVSRKDIEPNRQCSEQDS